MNRKIAFGIVLFVGIGLFMFTFANPNDKVDNNNGSTQANNTTNEVQNKETDNVAPVINLADPTNVPVEAPAGDNGNTNAPVVPNNGNANVVDNALVEAKEAAIAELKNYKNDYDYPNKEDYNSIVNKYVDEINKASTIDSVNKSLEDGKNAIDTLINEIEAAKSAEELAEYKKEAKEKINEYAKDVDLEEAKKEEIITDASKKIDEATTKEEVDGIVESTEKLLDEASLNEYKEAAKEELKAYKNDEKYTEENQTVVDGIKETGITDITNAETKDDVDNILATAKEDIDNVPVLTYTVTFKDFYNNETKVEVTHDTLVTAPVLEDVVERNITRKFIGWDKDLTKVVTGDMVVTAQYEITKVVANIYMLHDGVTVPTNGGSAGTKNYDLMSQIELDLTKENVKKTILERINKNRSKVITLDETEIKNMVVGELPYANNKEYVYTYYVLKFEKGDGFHIDYYRTSNEAPVITLTGDTYKEVYEQRGHYDFTKGFSVSDDHTSLTNSDVKIEIIKNGVAQVEKVNYEKIGTYVINYTVSDAEGNTTTVSRTVKVLANTLEKVELASDNDTYEYGAELNLKVNGTYANGDVREVAYTITNFDTNLVGSSVAYVTVEGFDPIEYTYSVDDKIVDLVLSSNDDTYEYGAALDLSVTAVYISGAEISNVQYDISNFNNEVVGNGTATVSYEGLTKEYNYTILNKLVRLALSSNDDVYYKGSSMKNLTVTAYYINGETANVEYIISDETPFNTTTVGKKSMTIYAEGQPLTYNYEVKYTEAQLKGLFNNTTASLSFWFDDSEIIFNHLPADATVVSVRREDSKSPVTLRKTNKNNVFGISWGDYDTLRHNWGYTIYVTYRVNGQEYTRGYGESFGDIS
nr:DUF5011 domain-containing protein [Bacilli bacterium]